MCGIVWYNQTGATPQPMDHIMKIINNANHTPDNGTTGVYGGTATDENGVRHPVTVMLTNVDGGKFVTLIDPETAAVLQCTFTTDDGQTTELDIACVTSPMAATANA